jgi:hypothetical protein
VLRRLPAASVCGPQTRTQPISHVSMTPCMRARMQYGPIFVETQIDPAKGGKVTATRMGRTYELVVILPPAPHSLRAHAFV